MFVGRDTLLDAGALVAFLNPRDQWHGAVAAAWRDGATRCITTEAVVVEATHLVARGRGDQARVLEALIGLDIPIVALHLPLHERCAHLMRRYADTPMDYADATLVALAERLDLTRVFTTDRKGFRTYRGARGVALEMIPAGP